MFKKVLVCLNGSKQAESVLPYAKRIARRFNCSVTLIKINTIPLIMYSMPLQAQGSLIPTVLSADQIADEKVKSDFYLNSLANQFHSENISASFETVIAKPGIPVADIIIDYSIKNEMDLIAMTTHGFTGLKRWLMGSVADRVIKRSKVPVLIFKPDNAASTWEGVFEDEHDLAFSPY